MAADAEGVLDALVRRIPSPGRTALVVAHPDDETIAAGASLHLLTGLLLIHVTDGAPRGLDDAARAGFGSPAAYAAARQAELDAAVALSGAAPERAALGVPDQDASLHIPGIAAALRRLFARHGTTAVLTHAYEGGHPDHDAVALACRMAAPGGRPGGVIEFPGYHAAPDGRLVTGRFLPRPETGAGPGAAVALDGREQARKRAMLGCFVSQAHILAAFGTDREAFRLACPDFADPPHPGTLNYEHWGWEMTGPRWRTLATAALATEDPCAA